MRSLALALVAVGLGSLPAFAHDLHVTKKAPVCLPVDKVETAAKTVAGQMGGTFTLYEKDDASKLMEYINNVKPKTNLPGDVFIAVEANGGALIMVSANGCVDHARDLKIPARVWDALVAKVLGDPDNSI